MQALVSQQAVYGTYSGLVTPDVNGYAVVDSLDFQDFTRAGRG